MTTEQKIIRTKIGVLELAKAARESALPSGSEAYKKRPPTRGGPGKKHAEGVRQSVPGAPDAPAARRMPSVTMPTFSTPAPLAASMTVTMSP